MRKDEEVTRVLAEWICAVQLQDIPAEVQREGVRTFVNWLGCAAGGAGHETVSRAVAAVTPFSGKATSTVVGRGERLDLLHAGLVNGISSHVLDYDDTHLKTVIHPAGPVASALLALAEERTVSGPDFLTALITGIEVECRIGNAVYPDHYDRGWHITGTAGVFGAAAAVGKVLGLSVEQMQWALGLAATQSSGLREMFGTMTKSFHPGRAAQNGTFAAFMAQAGYDSSLRGLEAKRGFAHVTSTKQDFDEITGGLGTRWEAALNSYKPFACGIVIHPTIDAGIQLRAELGDDVNSIERVDLVAHPLVLELTGKKEPRTELEGKFSVYHCAAAALLKGDGSPTAFADEVVNDPQIVSLRSRVHVRTDADCAEDSVTVTVTLADGRRVEKHVEHAVGSVARPLSDSDLDAKFLGQAALVIGDDAARDLLRLAWTLADLASVGDVAKASVPHARRTGTATETAHS